MNQKLLLVDRIELINPQNSFALARVKKKSG